MLYWVSNISWRLQTYNAVLIVSMLTGFCLFRDMRPLVPCLFNGCQKSYDETSEKLTSSVVVLSVCLPVCLMRSVVPLCIEWVPKLLWVNKQILRLQSSCVVGLPVCSIRHSGALCFCKGRQKSNDETNKIEVFSRCMSILLGSLEIKCWLTRFCLVSVTFD